MSRRGQLANLLERTVTGPMWHGPSLADVLDGIPAQRAAGKPIPGAHSIWEIVRHVTAWAEISRRRLHGDVVDPTPDEDWPPVDATAPDAWAHAVEELGRAYRGLAAATRTVDDARLDTLVAGQEYSIATMLLGVVEHGTYHGGQIALLKKV